MKTDLERRLDLTTRINEFLKVRVLSRGGYAPVSPDDLGTLRDILSSLVHLKWGADEDGDVPVEIDIVDRTRFERMHFEPIPYTHKGPDAGALPAYERALDAALFNLKIAADRVDTANSLVRTKRRPAVQV